MFIIYLLCSPGQTHISYFLRGRSLYDVVASLESSYALKDLFLFETLLPLYSAHPLS